MKALYRLRIGGHVAHRRARYIRTRRHPRYDLAMRALIFVLAAPMLIAACAATDGPGSSPSPSPRDTSLEIGGVPPDLFTAILQDAAGRAGVDSSAFSVSAASAVTWSDGSLGCPEPGMFYTQALVPGYRVVLEAAGNKYDYHADRRGNFSLCPPDRAKDPVPGGGAL
jgi:hypothetical protein